MTNMHIAIASPIETVRFSAHLKDTTKLPKGMGGTAVNHLILGLLAEGIKISVYTLTPEIEDSVFVKEDRLSIFYGPYRKKARYRMVDLFKKEANCISGFAKDDAPDLVHAHWGYEYAYGAIQSKRPHLITLRDSPAKVLTLKKDLYRFSRYLLHRKVMRRGQNFLVNSPYLNQVFNAQFPVIPNPVIQYADSSIAKQKPPVIISVLNGWGNIKNAQKGLEAFALLRKKTDIPIEYHLIGHDFGEGEKAQLWARSNQLDKGVKFKGALSHKELIKSLQGATIMLHTSKEESFGNVIAEALSVGLPVIGGQDAGAVPWLLDGGRRGVLVDVNSAESMCKALNFLLSKETQQQSLSKIGLKFVENNLTLKAVTLKHLEIYHQLLNR